ncbi:DUF3833 domain-containing protein [Colwellia sp. 1_MG-2023]|uniref:DUF3833 domain-containing protein n=1 Tax=unclassified Colwellia TaxID=196834 RepID=UPI001C0975BF|nr:MULTISPECIES: DUF3833 domain-containing protein [unclassified Colwellia]MBU2925887.1 DUF3833 domain-containing protein [Colwellia sp. C2M11]MDO6489167.1 DUF3833 domain-containing protein [Colwellia sp. 6_MG-2023]MDO6652715.1 DUF3833 domain-containing protein [Colwellia sp. 3_MG-2023]MDO6665590.1 DUF3833 domain-containing protein [Colwellia sp. 2_MG-2023]MDO6689963.1 DUF3833 domain-containing protein [Colwellia sp. 1_MG-2023]
MNKLIQMVLISIIAFFLASCSTALQDYKETEVPFDIKQYFNGNVIAWGTVQDYSQQVTRRFCVEIIGTWEGNKGTLAEKFYFNDGEVSFRNWQLTKQKDGSYRGTAEDVAGIAIGKHQGFAFQFKYDLLLKLDDETYQVSMDDWMYQIDKYRVMNKTSMSKFGIDVAEITLFFDKEFSQKTCQ